MSCLLQGFDDQLLLLWRHPAKDGVAFYGIPYLCLTIQRRRINVILCALNTGTPCDLRYGLWIISRDHADRHILLFKIRKSFLGIGTDGIGQSHIAQWQNAVRFLPCK